MSYPQVGNNLWTIATLPGVTVAQLVHPSGVPSRWSAAHDGRHLGRAKRDALRGAPREAALLGSLRKQGARRRRSRKRAHGRQVRTTACTACRAQEAPPASCGYRRASRLFRDPRSASATEGVRVTKIGVTNLRREQSLLRGARLGESRRELLIEGSSAGLASQEAARDRHQRHGAREAARSTERSGGLLNEALGRCVGVGSSSRRLILAGEQRREKMDHLGSSCRGQLRRCEPGLGRSRSCSWIVPIAGAGARRSSSVCESRSRESKKRAQSTEARRSGLTRTPSFDEAAEAADLVLFRASHRMWRAVRGEVGQPARASGATRADGKAPRKGATESVSGMVSDRPPADNAGGGSEARRALDQGLTGSSGAGSRREHGTSRPDQS